MTKLIPDKDRFALSFLENIKTFAEKTYPNDKKLIEHLREAVHIVAWRVFEKESRNEGNINNSRRSNPD